MNSYRRFVSRSILAGICLAQALFLSREARAEVAPPQVRQLLGGPHFDDWTGLSPVKAHWQAHAAATLTAPGEATFLYPSDQAVEGSPGAAKDARNWRSWYGLRFDVEIQDDRAVTLDVWLRTASDPKDGSGPHAPLAIQGRGRHTVMLPWSGFNFPQTSDWFLTDIKGLSVGAAFADGKPGQITIGQPEVIRAETVWLTASPCGESVEAGGTAEYEVAVGNATDSAQAVTLSFEKDGFESMTTEVTPDTLLLQPGEIKSVVVKVIVPARVPPGGHESQILRATANGVASPSANLELVTASALPYPNILHTADEWAQVRENVQKYDWAKAAFQRYQVPADSWNVPEVAQNGVWLYRTETENDFMAAGIAYQVTQDSKYAEKVRAFLLRFSNQINGYPKTRRAVNDDSVQEGHFFQHIAMSYDMTIPSGVYTPDDRRQIDQTLRLYVDNYPGMGGNISNWSVSSLCGGLYCALALQDLAAADHFLHAKGGLIDQLVQGTLDDGWWFEVSISYNTWVASEFTQAAVALRPWGYDLAHASFPSAFRPNPTVSTGNKLFGMSQERWGPIHNNFINIKRMWDALPPMVDYRGVIFGLNDSAEKSIGGGSMDIAYYVYRDPAYAPVIRRGDGTRDLLYAVPELPDGGPDLSTASVFADNAGVAVLRSQTVNRPEREQIEAVLHYGDHGWFHGHFDLTDLLHLSRYGRSFWNPEDIWYGYPNFMYKFFVQTSAACNMVVVDQKMQEPVESHRLLFHSGPMMQAAAVESDARWSNPPYGGMVYANQPYKTFADKAFAEGRSVPVPPNLPEYGAVTDYTEPVLQRRLMLVTDDYVVVDDYLKSAQPHTFDALFQMKAFQGLESADKKLVRHTGQWSDNPLSSAQFVTDADWYDVQAPARASFQFDYSPGADNTGLRLGPNDPGVLKMDLHTLWPPRQEIMLATPPITQNVQRQVIYAVRGDGKTLASGKSGVWILGEKNIDIPVTGVKSLELESTSTATNLKTLFWAGARIVTAGGTEIPLSQLPLTLENTATPPQPGLDFAGGPIKIAGILYAEASSAQPQDAGKPSLVRVDLSGVQAARFKCVLGGDFPVGNEDVLRKIFAVRSTGTEAHFLTVIEPYEKDRMVTSADATGPDTLQVLLADGRVQDITISNLEGSGKDIVATITESKDGKAIRSETTNG